MKTNTKQLSAALASIGRIIKPTRSWLPILSCVKLESANGELVITGTSLDEYQTEIVACEGDLESVAVNLGHLMWSIGSGEEVTLNVEKQRLEIEETGSSLAISPVVEFDGAISGFLTPNSKDGLVKIGVSVEDVFELVKSVAWAASNDVSRPAFTRTHIVGSAKNLKSEATDGYILAWNERAVISADFEMCVENDFASNLCEVLSRKGADLSQNSDKISVAHESGAYMCKKSELRYFNTKSALTNEPFIKIGEIDWPAMKEVAQRVVGLCSERHSPLGRLKFGPSGLLVTFSDGTRSGTVKTTLGGEFKPLTIALDMNRVLKALGHLESDKIEVWAVDDLSPVKFTSGDMAIIMCVMRLPAEE